MIEWFGNPEEELSRQGWTIGRVEPTMLHGLRFALGAGDASGVIREYTPLELSNELPALASVAREVARMANSIETYDVSLSKVWLQRSTSAYVNAGQGSVPFIPHIDGTRYLKAMVYASNVGEGDGAMVISSQAPNDREPMRENFPSNYKERGLNVVEVDTRHLTSLYGPAGHVVVFDTNTPHAASRIEPGCHREIVRLDFGSPSWRSPIERRLPTMRRWLRGGREAWSHRFDMNKQF